MDTKKNLPYYSSDIGLAAALILSGHDLVGIQIVAGSNRARFVFNLTPTIEVDSSRYYSKQLMVPALAYSDTLKSLKYQINTLRDKYAERPS